MKFMVNNLKLSQFSKNCDNEGKYNYISTFVVRNEDMENGVF